MRFDSAAAGRLASALVAVLLSASCATGPSAQPEPTAGSTRDVVARAQLRAVLAELPGCPRDVEGSVLIISPGNCTKRACAQACCNACGWLARAQNGAVDEAQVKAVLKLPDSSMDCEIAMWSEVLSAYRVNLTQGCVKR